MKKFTLLLCTLMLFASTHALFATNYVVSGAGASEVNGTYIETGALNGKPLYIYNDGSYEYAIGYQYGIWIIGPYQSHYIMECYHSEATSDTPPSTGWVRMMADPPVPTVEIEGKSITYSASIFQESDNDDGSIITEVTITHNNYDGETFTGNTGDNFVTNGKVTVNNVPDGLTASMILTSPTTIRFTLTGTVAAHNNANDISNLEVVFANTAFTGNDASAVSNSTKSDLGVNFIMILHVPSSYGTIAAAIAVADSYDIIDIAAGTYTEPGLNVDKELTIKGEGANSTFVQAATTYNTASNRVFNVSEGLEKVVFSGLTIRYGDLVVLVKLMEPVFLLNHM